MYKVSIVMHICLHVRIFKYEVLVTKPYEYIVKRILFSDTPPCPSYKTYCDI